MNAGKPSEPTLAEVEAVTVQPELLAFAKWLLNDPRAVEVWGLVGTRLAKVECVAHEAQSLELDSGDWFLVRVSGMPTSLPPLPTIPVASGIVRFKRLVGKTESE